jgi:hypothetical protein
MAKVKRSQIATFLNTTPETPHVLGSASATYALLGPGVVSGKIAMNPKSTEETYLADDNASIAVDSYAPTMPVEQTAMADDEVFNFVDQLRLDRAVLGDAETDVVNVWKYETGGPTAYPAEQQKVSIQVDDFGGDGGVPAKINYTINFVGTPVLGTFNSTTKVFTATP